MNKHGVSTKKKCLFFFLSIYAGCTCTNTEPLYYLTYGFFIISILGYSYRHIDSYILLLIKLTSTDTPDIGNTRDGGDSFGTNR